ncbi:unnamed protein product [Effrenium voratum]|nr:unnamed protein product [Effrenium voratum]
MECISIRQDLHVAESPLGSPSSMGRSSSNSSAGQLRSRSSRHDSSSRELSPWRARKGAVVPAATDDKRVCFDRQNEPRQEFSPAFRPRQAIAVQNTQKKSEPPMSPLWLFCAGPSLERARPLINGLRKSNMEVLVRTDDHLKSENPPIKSGDFVLVLWSQFFTGPHGERLAEICDAAGKMQARVLNDIRKLQDMQDRRWLLRKLQDHSLPTPGFVECSRGGGNDVPDTLIEEHEDYIVVDARRINKPFVEKPVDRRDRDIYVYYPRASGGGRALLSTRESGDVEYVCRFEPQGRIRKEGSFIYQEYLQSEGFVIQVVCVGGNSYGNAVLSGVVSRARGEAVSRPLGTGPEPCPVWLRQEEKIMASKLQVILSQTLFGLTLLRSQTASGNAISYIIDVWPGIPRSGLGAHNHDVVRALQQSMKMRINALGFTRARSLPKYSAEEGGEETDGGRSVATPRSRMSDVSHKSAAEAENEEADLICVLLVARHSERTPKQKVKAKVNLPSDYGAGMLLGWLQGGVVAAESVLVMPRTMELRARDQLMRLADAARELSKMGHDVGTLADALNCISKEGATCHAKVGCDDGELVVGLKWGGELTAAGISDAEEFGRNFRNETYPSEVIDELHATLRHDIKIYASKESRCQQTAAAVCKGLMRTHCQELPPLITAMVRTDEFGRLGGGHKNYVKKDKKEKKEKDSRKEDKESKEEQGEKEQKEKEDKQGKKEKKASEGDDKKSEDKEKEESDLPPADTPWVELEGLIGIPCVSTFLRRYPSPAVVLQELAELMEELVAALKQGELTQALAGGETPLLLRGRYEDVLNELKCKPPKLDKVQQLLDNLEYDERHNRQAFPEAADKPLASALPLAKDLCDVVVPLETALQRRGDEVKAESHGMLLLDKLRWDLRVASGADLGDHDKRHLLKHEALYKNIDQNSARANERKSSYVRSRLYFSHNSQLTGLLYLMLNGLERKESAGEGSPLPSTPSTGSSKAEVRNLHAQRLGFMAHFIVRLWRKRSDGSLRVICDVSPSGSFDARVRLFDLPFAEVDAVWSEVLEPMDRLSTDFEKCPRAGGTP